MIETKTNTTRTILRSDELSCPSCVAKIEKALKALPGVETAQVHFNTGRIEITHDPELSSVDALVQSVQQSGYTSHPASF